MIRGPLFHASFLWTEVFWLSFTAWILHEAWVFSRDRRAAKGADRDGGSIIVISATIGASMWAVFSLPYFKPEAAIPLRPDLVFWTAIALIWAGLAYRFWAIQTLGAFFRTRVFLQEGHRLITTGPYRFIRNPSYTGAVVTLIGVGLAQGNGWSLLAVAAGGVVGYGWRVIVEERALAAHFGDDWQAWRKRTWALIPFVW